MGTVTQSEFQQHPAAALDRVQAGEWLLIVRDGHPVAELRPPSAPTAARPRGQGNRIF